MVNLDLAGGSLLDLGIYALTWVFQTLYHTQPDPQPPTVLASLRKYRTGADDLTTMLLTFPRRDGLPDAHGIATCGLPVATDPDGSATAGPAIRVQGDRGEIQVFPPAYRPTRTKLVLVDGTVEEKTFAQPGPGEGSGWRNGFGDPASWAPEGVGHGMFWEADECAVALRDGRKEGRYEGLEESLVIMRVMDEVRRQNDLRYPEKIETTQYPVEL
jgi:predicted dehydrogenase